MEKKGKYTKWEIRRAVSSALQDAYMKHLKGWEAKIFSGNFNTFIEEETIKYLENPSKKQLKP